MITSKFSFDPTVNLGHILTFVGFLATGFAAYTTLDKRVVVLEQQAMFQAQRNMALEQTANVLRGEVREALRDVHVSLEKVNDRLQQQQLAARADRR